MATVTVIPEEAAAHATNSAIARLRQNRRDLREPGTHVAQNADGTYSFREMQTGEVGRVTITIDSSDARRVFAWVHAHALGDGEVLSSHEKGLSSRFGIDQQTATDLVQATRNDNLLTFLGTGNGKIRYWRGENVRGRGSEYDLAPCVLPGFGRQ